MMSTVLRRIRIRNYFNVILYVGHAADYLSQMAFTSQTFHVTGIKWHSLAAVAKFAHARTQCHRCIALYKEAAVRSL